MDSAALAVADATCGRWRGSAWADEAPNSASATPGVVDFLFERVAFGTEQPELALVDDWAPECS